MGDKTGIQWTDATWNPIRGCSRVSEGCRNCYAEKVAKRFNGPGMPYDGLIARTGQWNGKITIADNLIDRPLRWKKPRRIFVNSMSDLFHENVPDSVIDKVFAVMALSKKHTFQILTKRPERMLAYCKTLGRHHSYDRVSIAAKEIRKSKGFFWSLDNNAGWHLPNVWLGVSVEDQATADERIPLLLQTPSAVRWISAEPLLGPIDLDAMSRTPGADPDEVTEVDDEYGPPLSGVGGIDWVVVGGESGPGARPMHLDWARSLRDQCQAADVPFFFKQWGEFAPNWFCDDDGKYDGGPIWMDRVGKKSAGRLLDGREHNEYPEVRND